jgi:hypothetical protein
MPNRQEAALLQQHDSVRVDAHQSNNHDIEQKVTIRDLRNRYRVTTRTIDRWLQRSHLEFPHPVMVVRDVSGRVAHRYWRLGDLDAWDRRQAEVN